MENEAMLWLRALQARGPHLRLLGLLTLPLVVSSLKLYTFKTAYFIGVASIAADTKPQETFQYWLTFIPLLTSWIAVGIASKSKVELVFLVLSASVLVPILLLMYNSIIVEVVEVWFGSELLSLPISLAGIAIGYSIRKLRFSL